MGVDFNINPILTWISNISKFGLEYASSRYYGLYAGTVDDNADPQGQARVRVCVPPLMFGTRDETGNFVPEVHPRFAHPATIYAGKDHGMYFPPEIGDTVFVSFDHGHYEVPRYHGSWWCNPDDAKSPETSHVPAEFRTAETPTKRGIKTKFGHGIIFSDDESEPYVTLWSGQQLGEGEEATKKQRITLSDRDGDPGIYADTFDGRLVHLNDKELAITISGKPTDDAGEIANSIKIEDQTGKITIKTTGAEGLRNELVIDDAANTITVKTKNPVQQQILLDGNSGSISILSPATVSVNAQGAITLGAVGGIAMASGAAPPTPPAPGVAVENGQGAKIINFVGAVTETLAAFTQTAATVLINAATSFTVNSALVTINAPAATIGPPGVGISLLGGLITIGNPIIASRVLEEELLTWLETHTHTGNLGAPTPVTPTFITGTPASLKDPLNPSQPNPIYITDTRIS